MRWQFDSDENPRTHVDNWPPSGDLDGFELTRISHPAQRGLVLWQSEVCGGGARRSGGASWAVHLDCEHVWSSHRFPQLPTFRDFRLPSLPGLPGLPAQRGRREWAGGKEMQSRRESERPAVAGGPFYGQLCCGDRRAVVRKRSMRFDRAASPNSQGFVDFGRLIRFRSLRRFRRVRGRGWCRSRCRRGSRRCRGSR